MTLHRAASIRPRIGSNSYPPACQHRRYKVCPRRAPSRARVLSGDDAKMYSLKCRLLNAAVVMHRILCTRAVGGLYYYYIRSATKFKERATRPDVTDDGGVVRAIGDGREVRGCDIGSAKFCRTHAGRRKPQSVLI